MFRKKGVTVKKIFATILMGGFLSQAAMAGDSIEVGYFRLLNEAQKQPTGCDIGTDLILDQAELMGPVAVLSNFVAGQCPIYIEPNKRMYDLELVATPCGSKIWEGTVEGVKGVSTLRVIDHRTRRCRDYRPAQVVVEETPAQGQTKTLYSQDREVCTAVAGYLVDPKSGSCAYYSNGCVRADMLLQGFVEPKLRDQCR